MKEIIILYTNYRGITSKRRIIPKEVIFSSNEWHTEQQWLLIAFDVERNADRSFACKDIKKWY